MHLEHTLTTHLILMIHLEKGILLLKHAAKCQKTLQFIIGLQFSSVVDYVVRSAVPIARQRKAIKPPRESDVHFFTDVSYRHCA